MSPAQLTIGLVALIAIVGFMMRGRNRDEEASEAGVSDVDRMLAEVSGADPKTAGELAAITSDGWTFVPVRSGIDLVPPPNSDLPQPRSRLDAGDAVGARVRRGAPDFDPWRLEMVGRDGNYDAWFFETEEAARAALDLLQRRIVRVPLDEDGEPQPVRDLDFDEARRRDEETEHALEGEDEPEIGS